MKLDIKHILILLVAAVTLMACDRGGLTTTGQPILLAPTEAEETRAMLDADSFNMTGNQIRVYDYYTPTSGDPFYYFATGNADAPFYGSDIAQSNGNSWPFLNKHEWTPDGVHKFFGWLEKDVAMGETILFAPEFDSSTQTLTIPQTTMSQTGTPQYDFMYSEISVRDLNEALDYTPVPMTFKHLFTAFKVTATDTTKNDFWLTKVTITGLKTTRGATVSFSDEDKDNKPSVVYTDPTGATSSTFVYDLLTDDRYKDQIVTENGVKLGLELDKNPKTVTPDDKNIENDDFILMWPHSNKDFTGAKIIVNYAYRENGELHLNCETIIQMDELKPWQSGAKNVIGLMFCDKTISLNCTVEPWEKTTETIEFTNQISVSEPMTWQSNTIEDIDQKAGKVYLYSDTEICAVCDFHIDTPKGATWTASIIPVEGSSDAFVIEDGTKYGYIGTNSQIKIRVLYNKPIQGRNAAILRITVQTADQRTIIANLMPTNVNDGVTEYMLIQNLING